MNRLVLVLVACAFGSCQCQPALVSRDVAGMTVTLDPAGGRVLVENSAGALVSFKVDDVKTWMHQPTYEMQFGMFDVEEHEHSGERTGQALEVTDAEHLAFTIWDSEDDAREVLVDGAIHEEDGGLVLTLKGKGDAVALGSARTFDHAIGFGAQTHDVDHVGQDVPLWVSEQGVGKSDDDELPTLWQLLGRRHTTHVPMPAFVTNKNAAFVVDTHAYADVDLSHKDRVSFEVWDQSLALRVFSGKSVREAQGKMVDHFGRPPLPPPWLLAPWIDAIFGTQSVRDRAQALRDAHIPSSALWTEDWRGGEDSGDLYRLDEDWDLDPALYPDFGALLADLQAEGFVSQVYFNTFLTDAGDVYDDAIAAGAEIHTKDDAPLFFTGVDRDFSPTALVDLSGSTGRDFVKQRLSAALALGVRGWMADFAEWMPVDGAQLESGEDPARAHNQYPVWWQEVNREAIEEAGLVDDTIVYFRSGHLGSQRLAQVMWAGDQRTTFDADDGLPTVMPIGIGLSAVGFPFVTHDIGGYQSSTNPPTSRELFFRWTALGAFSPVMRTHHGTHAHLNWNLFTDAETTTYFKRMADMHVRLYPYLRALSIDAVGKRGLPLWIPLPLLFPKDDDVWPLKDEVLLGPSLLIAPVVTEGALARDVVFPSARWAPLSVPGFNDGAEVGVVVDGPATQSVDAPLDAIPVFVRAGGIVPLLAEAVDTLLPGVSGVTNLDDTEGDRFVLVALGADGSFVEEGGASYVLTSEKSATPPEGDVAVTGNDVIEGAGFRLVLQGHPADRVTTVRFR